MKEQHPIDELFARTLRDAEAEPPPQALNGILRERERRRAGWLRRWGWLPLLLLCGTGLGYLLAGDHPAGPTGPEPKIPALDNRYTGEFPGGLKEAGPNGLPGAIVEPIVPAQIQTGNNTGGHAGPAPNDHVPALGKAGPAGVELSATGSSAQVVQFTGAGLIRSGAGISASAVQPERHLTSVQASAPLLASANPQQAMDLLGDESVVRYEGSNRAGWLPVLLPGLGSAPEVPSLHNGLPFAPARARRSWWLAATAGQFRESRTWTGGDAAIREALQATEPIHATTAMGVLAGVNGRGGWSLAIGAEYHAGRYDFRHVDRFQTRHDSIFNHVITFNSLVLQTTTDTITTFRQEQHTAASVNQYAMLRIPVELGWHAPWGRFRLGARAGLALELTNLRSGTLLVNGPEGLLSVAVQPIHKQCMSVLGGSLGADLGYILTEHWSLWASPVYEKGLLSLLPPDNSPYALAGRTGIRLRLAYTLRP